jgi:hypothetical protein
MMTSLAPGLQEIESSIPAGTSVLLIDEPCSLKSSVLAQDCQSLNPAGHDPPEQRGRSGN